MEVHKRKYANVSIFNDMGVASQIWGRAQVFRDVTKLVHVQNTRESRAKSAQRQRLETESAPISTTLESSDEAKGTAAERL